MLFSMGVFCRIETLIINIKKGRKLSYIGNSQEKRYWSSRIGLKLGGIYLAGGCFAGY